MRPYTQLLLACFSCAPLIAQDKAKIMQHLRDFAEQFRLLLAERDDAPISDKDLDLLDDAKLASKDFGLFKPMAAAALLRLASTLPDAALPYVEEFAIGQLASDSKTTGAWPFTFVLVQRQRFDAAVRVLVAQALQIRRELRSYSTWKRVAAGFEHRDDYLQTLKALQMAMVDFFPTADADSRLAIADLLDEQHLAESDLPALRNRLQEEFRVQEEDYRRTLDAIAQQEADQPAKIWVEDRRGLRLVDRAAWSRAMGSPLRTELRFVQQDGADAPRRDWGVLVSTDSKLNLRELHSWLLDLGRTAQDPCADLGSRLGVISVYNGPDTRDRRLAERLSQMSDAMSRAVCIAVMAQLAVTWQSRPDAAHGERLVELARDLLAAVRAGAMHGAGLVLSQESVDQVDAANDIPVIASLERVCGQAQRLLLATGMLDPSHPTSDCQDMGFSFTAFQGKARSETCGRTRVRITAEEVTAVEFSVSRQPSSGDGFYRMQVLSIPRRLLHDAKMTPSIGRHDICQLHISTSSPFLHRFVDSAVNSGAGSMRSMVHNDAFLTCDGIGSGQSLVEAMQRRTIGEKR